MVDATDEALCGMIRNREQAAFTVLYDRYRNQIYGYTLKLCGSPDVALDAVQEVFMQVWLRHETLDPALSLKSYLFRSARNYVFDYLKKAVHSEKFRQSFLQSFEEGFGASDHLLYTKQLEAIKMNAISRLPAQRQLIYKMSKVEGFSNQEIADRLGISINTVRDQLVKASRFVRSYLHRHADIAILLAAFRIILPS
ncbi:RNA polymerase sigma-70 factor [Chitinophaga sp. 22620]|uniref:RNA polymerase sigma-70 factor n=1 Tax=Chitinophaga sp. 22620 TaxID=3453952 RepID=UPI003F84B5D2